MTQDITFYTLDCIIGLAEAFIAGAGYTDFEITQVLIDTVWYKDSNDIAFNEISVRSKDGYVLNLRWDIAEESFYDYIDPEEEEIREAEEYGKQPLPELPE